MGKLIWIWNQHMVKQVCIVFLFVSENNKTAVHVCVQTDRLFQNKEGRIVT